MWAGTGSGGVMSTVRVSTALGDMDAALTLWLAGRVAALVATATARRTAQIVHVRVVFSIDAPLLDGGHRRRDPDCPTFRSNPMLRMSWRTQRELIARRSRPGSVDVPDGSANVLHKVGLLLQLVGGCLELKCRFRITEMQFSIIGLSDNPNEPV